MGVVGHVHGPKLGAFGITISSLQAHVLDLVEPLRAKSKDGAWQTTIQIVNKANSGATGARLTDRNVRPEAASRARAVTPLTGGKLTGTLSIVMG